MAQQGRVAKSKLKNGLTPKQAKYVEEIAKGQPGYKAAMIAYDTKSPKTANDISVENQHKPAIKEAIEKAIGHHGITAEQAVLPVRMALDYEGDTNRDTLDMRLKGLYAYLKLAQFVEGDKDKSGNTFIFNNGNATNNFLKK